MNSEVTSQFYTVQQLTSMHLPGYPTSARAWYSRVEKEGWEYREVVGRGPGGIRREYQPPPEVMALIKRRLNGELPPAEERNVARDGGAQPQQVRRQQPAEPRDPVLALLDPTDEERLQMLAIVLKVAEHKLKEPITADLADKLLQLEAAWRPFAENHPEYLVRLEALRTAAELFKHR